MRFSQVLSLSACAVVLALPSFSAHAAKDPDKTIAAQLDEMGYKYEVDSDGDYLLQMQLANARTQLVYVRSAVEKYGHFQVREVWSPAYTTKGDAFSAAVADHLLKSSHQLILGGWAKVGKHAMLVVKIPHDASVAELNDAIESAARTADEVEMELAEDVTADEF